MPIAVCNSTGFAFATLAARLLSAGARLVPNNRVPALRRETSLMPVRRHGRADSGRIRLRVVPLAASFVQSYYFGGHVPREASVKHQGALGVIVLLAAISASAQPAQAGLHFCNDGAVRLEIAISYPDPARGWVAEGWWAVDPGQCRTVIDNPLNSRYYYFFAHDNSDTTRFSGETPYCIQDKKFTIYQAQFTHDGKRNEADCTQAGLRLEKFKVMDTANSKNFTNRLRADAPAPAIAAPAPSFVPPQQGQRAQQQLPAAAAPAPQPAPAAAPNGGGAGAACQRFPNLC
jgi:uncharacterized membrane protein